MSLTSETEAFVAGRVASGRFRSASGVVSAALQLPEKDKRRREALEHRDRAGERRVGR